MVRKTEYQTEKRGRVTNSGREMKYMKRKGNWESYKIEKELGKQGGLYYRVHMMRGNEGGYIYIYTYTVDMNINYCKIFGNTKCD